MSCCMVHNAFFISTDMCAISLKPSTSHTNQADRCHMHPGTVQVVDCLDGTAVPDTGNMCITKIKLPLLSSKTS